MTGTDIADAMESVNDRIVIPFFTERGYTIERTKKNCRVDYRVTNPGTGKSVWIESKVRDRRYDNYYISKDKIDYCHVLAYDTDPVYLFYFVKPDTVYIVDAEQVYERAKTVEVDVYNPARQTTETEENYIINTTADYITRIKYEMK